MNLVRTMGFANDHEKELPHPVHLMFSWFDHCYLVSGVFDVLAYTDTDVAVPFTWIESDPKLIANPQMVKLHAFDTKVNLDWQFD